MIVYSGIISLASESVPTVTAYIQLITPATRTKNSGWWDKNRTEGNKHLQFQMQTTKVRPVFAE